MENVVQNQRIILGFLSSVKRNVDSGCVNRFDNLVNLQFIDPLRTCFKSPFGRGAEGEGGMDHTANSGGFLPNNPHPHPLPEGEGTRIGNFKTRS